MKRRGYLRVQDDAGMNEIDAVAEKLAGFDVVEKGLGAITGQVEGSFDDADMERLRTEATARGFRFVPSGEEPIHRLPGPDSDLQ